MTCIFITMGKRKFKLNELFFDKIDTEEKAYFLGFLYADGCNLVHRNRITLKLHEKDYEILKRLNDLIYEENTIKTVINDTKKINHFIKGKPVRFTGNSIFLIINSKYLSKRLNEIGMTPKKSLTLTFPFQLDKSLYSHFIRGYFDGDGSLMKMKNKGVGFRIKIASSENFCKSLKQIIEKELGIKINGSFVPNRMSTVTTTGIYATKLLSDWLYKDSTIYMKRKRDLYEELIDRTAALHKAKYKYIYRNVRNNLWIADVYLGNKKISRLGENFPTEIAAYTFQQNWKRLNLIDK